MAAFRDCDLLRKLFETVVRRCMAEGLVDGTDFAVDASLIAADANKQRSSAGSDDIDWEAVPPLHFGTTWSILLGCWLPILNSL